METIKNIRTLQEGNNTINRVVTFGDTIAGGNLPKEGQEDTNLRQYTGVHADGREKGTATQTKEGDRGPEQYTKDREDVGEEGEVMRQNINNRGNQEEDTGNNIEESGMGKER